MGGSETVVCYNLAKVNNDIKPTFGSTLDREKYSEKALYNGKDLSVPSPSNYTVVEHSSKVPRRIFVNNRRIDQPECMLLPENGGDSGPGAERAMQVMAERKQL